MVDQIALWSHHHSQRWPPELGQVWQDVDQHDKEKVLIDQCQFDPGLEAHVQDFAQVRRQFRRCSRNDQKSIRIEGHVEIRGQIHSIILQSRIYTRNVGWVETNDVSIWPRNGPSNEVLVLVPTNHQFNPGRKRMETVVRWIHDFMVFLHKFAFLGNRIVHFVHTPGLS